MTCLTAQPNELVGEVTTVRGVLLHVIEEVARHAGHLDIARELLDGSPRPVPDEHRLRAERGLSDPGRRMTFANAGTLGVSPASAMNWWRT